MQIKQLIEFEWKPLYHENCHKIGHECKNGPQKKPICEKQWIAEHEPNDKVKQMEEAPSNDTNTKTKDKDNDHWKIVGKRRKDKGKNQMVDKPEKSLNASVQCYNGFSPLRILNDPLVASNNAP